MDNPVLEKWSALRDLVNDLDLHVVKNAKGVAAAGVRTRKGLRDLKRRAGDLIAMTLELDKAKRGSTQKA